MSSRLSRVVCCSLALVAVSLAPSAQAKKVQPTPLFERINDVRERHGLRPLKFGPSLAKSSRTYARHLMRSDKFEHVSPIRAKGRFSAHGEILAFKPTWNPRPMPAIRQWLRSSGHRALLLGTGFTHAGAAIARGRYDGRLAMISIVQFGRR